MWKINAICLKLLKMIYHCMVIARFPVDCFTFPSSPHFRLEKEEEGAKYKRDSENTRESRVFSRVDVCLACPFVSRRNERSLTVKFDVSGIIPKIKSYPTNKPSPPKKKKEKTKKLKTTADANHCFQLFQTGFRADIKSLMEVTDNHLRNCHSYHYEITYKLYLFFFRSVSWDGSYSIWSNNLCYGWKIMKWVSPLEFLRTVTVSKKLNLFSINPYSPYLLR